MDVIEKEIAGIQYVFVRDVYYKLFNALIFIKIDNQVRAISGDDEATVNATMQQCVEWANSYNEKLLTVLVKSGLSISRLIHNSNKC